MAGDYLRPALVRGETVRRPCAPVAPERAASAIVVDSCPRERAGSHRRVLLVRGWPVNFPPPLARNAGGPVVDFSEWVSLSRPELALVKIRETQSRRWLPSSSQCEDRGTLRNLNAAPPPRQLGMLAKWVWAIGSSPGPRETIAAPPGIYPSRYYHGVLIGAGFVVMSSADDAG